MAEVIDHQAREAIAVMRSQSQDLNQRFKEHLDVEEAMAKKMDKRSECMERDIAALAKRSAERQAQEKERIAGYQQERERTEAAADRRAQDAKDASAVLAQKTNFRMGLATIIIAAVAIVPQIMAAFE